MRPICLRMTAFGPYPDKTEIDFTYLKDNNIFVIAGPTGSGKTTIFDAICYALYGETSGNKRSGKELRSDFVDIDGAITEVEFIFSSKGKDYYIRRVPAQMRRKKRGEGTVEYPAKVEFKELNSANPPLTRVDEVNEAIEKIIGIKANQFRKIVMIPQGDFREFLSASTTEKEEILRKIFGSEYYKTFQDKLNAKAENLRKEVEKLSGEIQGNIKLIDAGDNVELKESITGDVPVSKIIELLEDFIKEEERIKDEENNEIEKLSKTIEKEQREYDRQSEINEKFEEKEKYESELLKLENRKNEIAEKEIRKAKAEKARLLVPYENSLMQRVKERDEVLKQLNLEKTNLEKAVEALSQAEERKKKADALEKKIENLNRQLVILSGYVDDAKSLDEKNKAIAKRSQEREELEKSLSEGEKKVKDLEKELEVLKAKEKEKAVLDVELQKLKADFADIENSYYICQNLYIENKRYSNNLKNIEEKRKLKKGMEEEIKAEKQDYEAKRNIYNNSSAIILARKLKEGEPCPVCGSIHHPAPNTIEGEIPTEKQLKEMEDVINKKQEKLNNLNMEISRLEGEQNALISSISQKFKQLQEKGWFSNKDRLDNEDVIKEEGLKISEKKKEVENKLKVFDNKVKEIALQLKTIEAKKHELDTLKAKVEENRKKHFEVSNAVSTLEGSLKDIYNRLPPEYRVFHKLEEDIRNCKENIDKFTEWVRKAAEDYDKANINCEKLKERVKGLNERLLECNEALKKAEDEFNSKVDGTFGSRKAYEEAKLSDELIKQLEKELEGYYNDLNITRDRVKKLSEELSKFKKFDTEIIKNSIYEHRKMLEEKRQVFSVLDKRVGINRKVLTTIKGYSEKISKKENEYKIVGKLAKMANGSGPEKISFETFVLMSYFDDVIMAANKRLQKMTSGRYYLIRRDESEGRGRGRRGLDLDIYDNYTGKPRPVSTLSGGESFQASLALALGLSDVVQQNSGGVELNTMFIDEGFGTLDTDTGTLDCAINMLMELQRNGTLVAVISHVNEIKERIPVKLIVEKGPYGSKVRFSGV
ncbi:MAG: SMC family ATPase [Clostridiaceae bacterium]|nr:SMC family ATPase [Clostridiaceae bacterium]